MIRTAIVALFLTIYTILVGPPLLLYSVCVGDVDLLYRLGLGGILFVVRAVGVRIRVEGVENVPAGVCLFVANHTSNADVPAIIGAIPRRIAVLAKESLFRIPIFGQALRLARFVPVDRANRDAAIASIEKASEALRQGTSFLIYPEGTRSPDGRLQAFKKGAFVMAIKAGVPIVPVACAGAHRIMKKRSWVVRPGEIKVRFQPAIDASKYTFEQRDELSSRVRASLAEALPPDQRPTDLADTPHLTAR
jgi:1-acyl-sn-glycerol-3-phosphate acyltransferase